MNQFQHFVSRKQEGRVAKRVVIGSYVAKMSSDFYLCTLDIWWPVIGQFSLRKRFVIYRQVFLTFRASQSIKNLFS